jgi:membrane protease subunit (stomatin/prohibitin family)
MFERYGLKLDQFVLESLSLPEALQTALDKRISMGMMGDLSKYTQYQVAESIPLAAQNEGGLAGIGAGLAAGMGVGQMMTGAIAGAQVPAPAPAATPAATDPAARLGQLKALLDQGLITQADFDSTKAEILKQLLG